MPSLPPPTSMLESITATMQSITAAANRPTLIAALVAALVALILLNFVLTWHCQRTRPGLARTIYRLVVCRGRRLPGALTKLVFPIHAAELTPERLTAMLRHGNTVKVAWFAAAHAATHRSRSPFRLLRTTL